MKEEVAFLLADISSFWGFFPSLIALLIWKKCGPKDLYLDYLVWGGTTISLLAFYLGYVYGASNLYLLHIYTIFEFVLLTLIFRPVLNHLFVKTALVTFPLFAAFNSIFIEKLITMNEFSRSISALLLMFYALSFFLYQFRTLKVKHMEREPLFWVSIGVLFYNAASFFIFVFSRDLEPFHELWFTYFGIHSLFTILLYTFYSIALWVQLKQPRAFPTN